MDRSRGERVYTPVHTSGPVHFYSLVCGLRRPRGPAATGKPILLSGCHFPEGNEGPLEKWLMSGKRPNKTRNRKQEPGPSGYARRQGLPNGTGRPRGRPARGTSRLAPAAGTRSQGSWQRWIHWGRKRKARSQENTPGKRRGNGGSGLTTSPRAAVCPY